MSSEAISTLRLSRWVRRRASFAVVVVLPEPCRPTIMIATGGTALRSMVWPSEPSVAISSSWTIFTTIWPGVPHLTTVAPIACSRTLLVKLLTTSSETSASSSARRTSRIDASTSASVSDPRRVSRSRMPPSFSDRLSNTSVVPCLLQALRCSLRSYPAKAGYPVRPSFSAQSSCSGILDHPLSRVMTSQLVSRTAPQQRCDDGYSKHFCARGRIALSGVDLRPQGPGGGSKRTSFRDGADIRHTQRKSILTYISKDASCKGRPSQLYL